MAIFFSFDGSEWHRWDSHIHALGTVPMTNSADAWETYLKKIEAATPAIHALGVTDYLCINGY